MSSFSEQVLSGQLTAGGWLELVLKLVLVLLLIYLAAWLFQKRVFPFSLRFTATLPVSSPLIRTVAIHPLSPGISLYLVEVQKRRLLLSVSAQHSTQLLLDLGISADSETEHA